MNKSLTFAYNACLFAIIALVFSWLISPQAISSSNFMIRLTEVWFLMALLFLISAFFGMAIYMKSVYKKATAVMVFIFGLWFFFDIFMQDTPFTVPNHISYFLYQIALIAFLITFLKEENKSFKTQTIFAILLVISQTLISIISMRIYLDSVLMTSVDYFFVILYYLALLRFFQIFRKIHFPNFTSLKS